MVALKADSDTNIPWLICLVSVWTQYMSKCLSHVGKYIFKCIFTTLLIEMQSDLNCTFKNIATLKGVSTSTGFEKGFVMP